MNIEQGISNVEVNSPRAILNIEQKIVDIKADSPRHLYLFRYSIFFCFQLLAISVAAQVKDTAKSALIPMPDTNIRVYEPMPVQNAEQTMYQYQHYVHGTSPGYRIQIDFGQERNAVNKTKADFAGKYPSVPSYITYKQPYFRVSVGDFRTRLEAVCFLNKVKKDYPAAFVVADKIVPPPLQ